MAEQEAPRWHVVKEATVEGYPVAGLVVYCDDTAMVEAWPPEWARGGERVTVLRWEYAAALLAEVRSLRADLETATREHAETRARLADTQRDLDAERGYRRGRP